MWQAGWAPRRLPRAGDLAAPPGCRPGWRVLLAHMLCRAVPIECCPALGRKATLRVQTKWVKRRSATDRALLGHRSELQVADNRKPARESAEAKRSAVAERAASLLCRCRCLTSLSTDWNGEGEQKQPPPLPVVVIALLMLRQKPCPHWAKQSCCLRETKAGVTGRAALMRLPAPRQCCRACCGQQALGYRPPAVPAGTLALAAQHKPGF